MPGRRRGSTDIGSVIDARHLTKRFKNSLALDDVSFDI